MVVLYTDLRKIRQTLKNYHGLLKSTILGTGSSSSITFYEIPHNLFLSLQISTYAFSSPRCSRLSSSEATEQLTGSGWWKSQFCFGKDGHLYRISVQGKLTLLYKCIIIAFSGLCYSKMQHQLGFLRVNEKYFDYYS